MPASSPSIMGATDNRAASVAALLRIQRSPWVRQLLNGPAPHTIRTRGTEPLPCPVVRQAFGGVSAGLVSNGIMGECCISSKGCHDPADSQPGRIEDRLVGSATVRSRSFPYLPGGEGGSSTRLRVVGSSDGQWPVRRRVPRNGPGIDRSCRHDCTPGQALAGEPRFMTRPIDCRSLPCTVASTPCSRQPARRAAPVRRQAKGHSAGASRRDPGRKRFRQPPASLHGWHERAVRHRWFPIPPGPAAPAASPTRAGTTEKAG
jgi:hypothetical protein